MGKGNADALMAVFGFFYSMSMTLSNLLFRAELFKVAPDIREELVRCLKDLVNLVASIALYFRKTLDLMTAESVTIDIHGTFPDEIRAFRGRCEKITEAMWKYQLLQENLPTDQGMM